MGRSGGYRANKENFERVEELRARLGTLKCDKWQAAGAIMQEIVALTSNGSGPSGGRVEPRACKYCGFYGHTRQHCAKKERDKAAAYERECMIDSEEREQWEKERELRKRKREECHWFQREKQSDWFDEWGIPWYKDKYIGATWYAP